MRRALGGRDLIAIGLGTMIGGGIFTTIGPGVAKAGPAIIIAFLLAGLASFFAALCYAELGSMVPIAGSAYTYAYATLGQLVAWIIGWDLILEYAVSAAPVASAFSSSVQSAAQRALARRAAGLGADRALGTRRSVVGVLELRSGEDDGRRRSARSSSSRSPRCWSSASKKRRPATTPSSSSRSRALVVFVIAGLSLFHPANLVPFAPFGWGTIAFGASGNGIVPAAALVFFTYIGFDTATTTAEETRNPKRDVPVGVLGSLAIGTVIYCTVALVLVGVVPWQHVDQNAALLAARRAAAQPVRRRDHHDRRDRRHDVGRADVAARSEPHLLRDGARPDAAAGRRGRRIRASRRRRA